MVEHTIVPIPTVEVGGRYKDNFDLVVGTRYGKEGVIPCHKNNSRLCISETGSNLCRGYFGHEEVETVGGPAFIVKCGLKVECAPIYTEEKVRLLEKRVKELENAYKFQLTTK